MQQQHSIQMTQHRTTLVIRLVVPITWRAQFNLEEGCKGDNKFAMTKDQTTPRYSLDKTYQVIIPIMEKWEID